MPVDPVTGRMLPYPRPRQPFLSPEPMAGQPAPMTPPTGMGQPTSVPTMPIRPTQPQMQAPPPQQQQDAGASSMPLAKLAGRQGGLGNFLGSDAALALAAGILEGGTSGEALGRGFKYALATRQPQQGDLPTSYREWALAGKPGTFADFLESRRQKAPVTLGSIPPSYTVEYDEQNRPISLRPLPGSPAAAEAEAAKQQQGAATTQSAVKAAGMLDQIGAIRQEFEGSKTPVTGTRSIPFAKYSNTPAGRVRSMNRALTSGVALGAIQRLKEASRTGATGFGAMSEAELDLLINDIGALDPDTTEPDIYLRTLDSIERRMNIVIDGIRRDMTPDEIRQLGLEPLLSGMAEPTESEIEAELRRRGEIP